ncbi:hypothetical protein KJ765_02995 [Candidatus Micrarchaeota archaeon]|nr:hypothetical protein [Candidatus Micrarchaeota archaeon]
MVSVMEYAVLFVMVGVLSFSAIALLSPPAAKPVPVLDTDSEGMLLETTNNEQIFENQADQTGSECGDMTDESNVQHLSHHPERFEDCLRQVDPAFLKEATGRTLEEILG